ncbi:pilus assembly protein [Dyella flava]|nr:PilC/PilY family type IV pilus protein [Dyella flava]GLQ49682.1 type IV fimbrial biogenesis PilY1 [Dyella flava]
MRTPQRFIGRTLSRMATTAGGVLIMGSLYLPAPAMATTPTLTISQTPLTVTTSVHPQVLIALGNSESMDGDLSGAIMTGSGALSSSFSSLSNSSSPTNYTIPSGFNPSQLGLGNSSCTAPTVSGSTYQYTYTCSNVQYDVSASRLNIAKQSILDIMQEYFDSTDFGLMDYNEKSPTLYTTWVYYMSPTSGDFTFTNTAPTSGEYVTNPCYNYTSSSTSSTVSSNCQSIANSGLYSPSSQVADQYMVVGASSDDADINDVLYASGSTAVSVSYGGPSPANPYTYYGISKYESGSITTSYSHSVPSFVTETSPTNAGYIPYQPQVMYALRGFGYGATDSTTGGSGKVVATDSSGNSIVSAGESPTSTTVATAVGYFTSALNAETNTASSSEIKALAGQSPLAGLMKSALTTLNAAAAPSYDCATPKKYVILITDGLPTEDLSGNFWPPLGSASASGYGVTATFNSNGSLNTTNDQALTDTITEITALKTAGIDVYVVGLGAGVDPADNEAAAQALQAMAVAGGTAGVTSQGYFPATSPATLVNDLASILNNVAAQNTSSSAVATNSTSLSSSSDIYQATFNPGSSTIDAWTGDLQAYAVSSSGVVTTSSSVWDAQSQLDTQGTNRYIVTWDPNHTSTSGTVTPTAVPFEWTDLSSTLQTVLNSTDSLGQNRLNYIRGDDTHDLANGGTFRTRQHLLGDIVDSSPAYVGAPSDAYTDASYLTFVSTNANRTPMIYVGANDGMLHGFNASTGAEAMAFIPNGVFANLPLLTSPYYLYNHHFFVDGSPYVDDAMLSDGHWHTLLVGGENAGGNTIYAIDVTSPSGYTSETNVASDVLWEYSDSGIGYTYSTPVIVRTPAITVTDATSNNSVDGFAVLFGNGYNSSSNHPVLYALNASTGAQIAKIDLCTASSESSACSSSAANGLSSITTANSSGLPGQPPDMVYAGDLQGNLWAINISNATPSNWTVKLLFQAKDSSGNAQPITSAPAVTLNPNYPSVGSKTYLGLMVYFGTGQLLQTSDLTSTKTQSFYGVWDNSSDLTNYTTAPTMPYTRSNLQSQTLSLTSYTSSSGSTVEAVLDTSNTVNLTYASESIITNGITTTYTPVEGWYFDLSPLASSSSAPAPRVINNPAVLNGGVLLTVNIPPNSTSTSCGSFSSYLMYANYATGGAFTSAAISPGTSLSTATASGGQYITGVELSASNASSSASTVITGSGTVSAITSSGGGSTTTPGAGIQQNTLSTPSHNRVGWWQVQ